MSGRTLNGRSKTLIEHRNNPKTGSTFRSDALGTGETLRRLAPDFVDDEARQQLVEAHRLYQGLTQMIRLCLTDAFERNDVPPGLSDLLLRSTDLPDFSILEAHLQDTARKVRKIFERLLRT